MKDKIHSFDNAIGTQIAKLPTWMKPAMQVFTWLGEPVVTVGIAALVLGYGFALSKPFYLTAGLIAIVTIAVGGGLKLILRRTRPLTEYVEKMFFKTFSFPSGHAAGSLVSFGLAAFVISNRWPEHTVAAWVIAIVSSILVGVSRIYLGAHYASDVIGGWIVGAIGVAFIVTEMV